MRNSFKSRDERNFDRLSSFFYINGKISIKRFRKIRENVLYAETNDGKQYILKGHARKKEVQQQWNFLKHVTSSAVVPFQLFKSGHPYIQDGNITWTITPFIPGQKLHYTNAKDRNDALNTLRIFHEHTADTILDTPLKKPSFNARLQNRLDRFKKTEHLFRELGFISLFTDIVQTTQYFLVELSNYPWTSMEKQARKKGFWIHGDVASHNFLRYRKKVYMIDFDLLCCAPPLYDYIQLGQRFLPYIDYNLDKLLAYKMVSKSEVKVWLYALSVPSDIQREWIYFLSYGSLQSVKDVLAAMALNWERRKEFLQNVELMLK